MTQVTLQSIGTVLAFVAFLGVCWWAYIAHKKSDFEEQANLPFADDEQPVEDKQSAERETLQQREQNDSDEKRL